MILYHYTCDHGHRQITDTIRPIATVQSMDGPWLYTWFTDLRIPQRDALGLTSTYLDCDRTTHRYRATDISNLTHWPQVRRTVPWAAALEKAPGVRPMHWWLSTEPVPVVYDPPDGQRR